MKKKIAWSILICLCLVTVYLYLKTEGNYVSFVKVIQQTQHTRIHFQDVNVKAGATSTKLEFSVAVENPTGREIEIRSISYFLYANGIYLGAYYNPGLDRKIPSHETIHIHLLAQLESYYKDKFSREWEKKDVKLKITGNGSLITETNMGNKLVGVNFENTIEKG